LLEATNEAIIEKDRTTCFLYIEDANRIKNIFENEQISDDDALECLRRLPYLCFMGGNTVQDILSSSNVITKIVQALHLKEDSILRANSLSTTLMGFIRSHASSTDYPENTASTIVALKALASLCRDSKANQKLVVQTGIFTQLVQFIESPRPGLTEKKWCIQVVFMILLTQSDAAEKIMGDPNKGSFLTMLKLMADKSLWTSWPVNEAEQLLHVLQIEK